MRSPAPQNVPILHTGMNAMARRLLGGLLAMVTALAGLGLVAPAAHAATLVAQNSQHSWHNNNRNKTIDTTVEVYNDGTVRGVSTVESGVWLTGVRLCAKAVLMDRDGGALAEVGGDCWGVNGTAFGYSSRTENWGGQVSPDIASRTYAVQIVHWNNGIDWGQVFAFAKKVWDIYRAIAQSNNDAAATDIVMPNGTVMPYSSFVPAPGGGGGGNMCGGSPCKHPL
ncbi:hypothetical protein [Microtetraspora sp. NBRC 16547]|uniref:hypothetical protein n=1 Tax=Microtetraspora sp. NBRC 16547 TaxID=3030993 RepID=UPI00249FFCAD|nr:hypothetical protein [Microtetraspora sp. NBRC 16547]GLX02346.1 hypothetical protein Misp02_64320 [Microtetraspora sp. NBRC 16547]